MAGMSHQMGALSHLDRGPLGASGPQTGAPAPSALQDILSGADSTLARLEGQIVTLLNAVRGPRPSEAAPPRGAGEPSMTEVAAEVLHRAAYIGDLVTELSGRLIRS